MERETQVTINGVKMDGVVVDHVVVGEPWSEYRLADDSTVRVRPVAIEFIRVVGQFDQEGNPMYYAKMQNVVSVTAPPNLRRSE